MCPDLAAAGLRSLPYLLKVLAIAEPLSLQAHPSAHQAEAGFAREEASGVPVDAPERTYRDASAKPEALVALEPTWALCGFRPVLVARSLVAEVACPSLAPLEALLATGTEPDALHAAMAWLLHLTGTDRTQVARSVAEAAATRATDDPASPWTWVADLAARYPDDPGCLAPLLLELVALAPDEGVHLPAGNLHAYLRGAGVEIMASSDNVLRGGLTPKHIDVDELLAILRFEPGTPPGPTAQQLGGVTVFDIGEEPFALARIDPAAKPVAVVVASPSLLLPIGGPASLSRDGVSLAVAPGQAAFVSPGSSVSVHSAVPVWWATAGPSLPEA